MAVAGDSRWQTHQRHWAEAGSRRAEKGGTDGMKTVTRRIARLEDQFGTADGKPRLLLLVCRAGCGPALDMDTCVQIFGECGFLPTGLVGLVNLCGIPRWPESGGNGEISAGKGRGDARFPRGSKLRWSSERMISRNLTRRLERLETRLMPAGEPLIIQVKFVSSDGSVRDGPRFTIPAAGGQKTGSAGLADGGRPGLAGRQYREGLHP
jgi:hypothetical protein